MASGIYQIRNIVNGKTYIGSAINLHGRKMSHFSYLRISKHHNALLQNAWSEYNEETFVFEAILNCPKEELIFWEQLAIDAYRELAGRICTTYLLQLTRYLVSNNLKKRYKSVWQPEGRMTATSTQTNQKLR